MKSERAFIYSGLGKGVGKISPFSVATVVEYARIDKEEEKWISS
jgi:hypothetical protein